MSGALAILAGLALLLAGAQLLVRGAAALALGLGITPLAVGLTVVAFGTSSPELLVSVSSALDGRGDLAVANAFGSNVLNVGLILGVVALVRPQEVASRVVRLDALVVTGATLLAVAMAADGRIGRAEGALLLALAILYTVGVLRASRTEVAFVQAEMADELPSTTGSPGRHVLELLVGLALLAGGAQLVVTGAVEVATAAGVADVVIGLTVVAVGTSLPELASSLAAALRGHADVAVGNVVGSNILNLLAILGVAALARPLDAPGIAVLDLVALVGSAVLLLPLLRTGMRLSRAEGALLVVAYGVYVSILVAQA